MLTWLEIDLRVIRNNIKQIKKYIGPDVGVAAVIKSNAYGHGLVEVAQAVSQVGVEFLCVDNVIEARQLVNSKPQHQNLWCQGKQLTPLRSASFAGQAVNRKRPKILILGGVESEDLPWVIKNNIRFGIYDLGFAKKVNMQVKRLGRKALVHIKIDTGMHRLGFDCNEAVESIKKIIKRYNNINIEGLWSHFADSGSRENKKYTSQQLKKFESIINELEKEGIKIKYKHLCNSSGTISLPEARFNLVRTGIIIYGIYPSETLKTKYQKKLNLKPGLSFKTRIISLRKLKKGERIGYGLTYRLKKDSQIAVLAVGYKDGYGRDLSNKGEVIIQNYRCPVVGRICMRMMMADVSSLKGVKLDEEAVLLGGKSRVRIEADEVAKKMDTIPYEVLSRISESVPRIYRNS